MASHHPGIGRLWPWLLPPRCPTHRCSDQADSSQPGSGSRPVQTTRAARSGLAEVMQGECYLPWLLVVGSTAVMRVTRKNLVRWPW